MQENIKKKKIPINEQNDAKLQSASLSGTQGFLLWKTENFVFLYL